MNPRYPATAERASHRCEYCRAPEAVTNFAFEVEHITPQATGGGNETRNLALSCRSCNAYKGTGETGTDPDTDNIVPLFNPRIDVWHEHFVYDNATGVLQGSTPTGRATVALLRMNTLAQRQARQYWMRLGIYP